MQFVKKPEGIFCPIMVYPKISMDNFGKAIEDVEKILKASEKMQFTKEDQYLTRALTEHFKNKYGDVAVIAIKCNQTMAFSGGLSSKQTITQLNRIIKQLQRCVGESKCEKPNKENKFGPLKLVKRVNNDE